MADGTTANTSDLKAKLQGQQNQVATKPQGPADTIRDYLERQKNELAKALPKHITADRLARVALTTIRTKPSLLDCDVPSLMAAVMLSAQLGLEPGPLGHSYIVPYGKKAEFQIGYKGYLDMMWRTNKYKSITVMDVCENDSFELQLGVPKKLIHKPLLKGNRGNPYLYYLAAEFKDGGEFFHWMTIGEIEKHRQRSRSKNDGPWVTDYEAMCKKTVVRDAAKWMPMSIEFQQAAANDEMIREQPEEDIINAPATFDADFKVVDEQAPPPAPDVTKEPAQADLGL